jgi:hypothetical protein
MSFGVDLEDRYLAPGSNAFQMKPGDKPVVGEAKGEVGFVVECQNHESPTRFDYEPLLLTKSLNASRGLRENVIYECDFPI